MHGFKRTLTFFECVEKTWLYPEGYRILLWDMLGSRHLTSSGAQCIASILEFFNTSMALQLTYFVQKVA